MKSKAQGLNLRSIRKDILHVESFLEAVTLKEKEETKPTDINPPTPESETHPFTVDMNRETTIVPDGVPNSTKTVSVFSVQLDECASIYICSGAGKTAVFSRQKLDLYQLLDTPLLKLRKGEHIFAGIGSGKTSGSGRMLDGEYLRAGMGGLVTAVKPEVDLWQRYARECARESSVLLFDENEGFNFAFVGKYAAELQISAVTIKERRKLGEIIVLSPFTEGLPELLGNAGEGHSYNPMRVLLKPESEAFELTISPTSNKGGGDAFWEDATRQISRNTIALMDALPIADIIRFISTAPTSTKDVTELSWQKRSFMYEVMDAAIRYLKVSISKSALDDRIIYYSRGHRIFCGRSILVPELTFHEVVIVMAMPTLTWNEDGIIAQQLFNYMWQRAVLGRNSLEQKHGERPVFLWSDEVQKTVISYDAEYQSICRGSKACTVYMKQSLPTYYAKMGGDNPRDAVLGSSIQRGPIAIDTGLKHKRPFRPALIENRAPLLAKAMITQQTAA